MFLVVAVYFMVAVFSGVAIGFFIRTGEGD